MRVTVNHADRFPPGTEVGAWPVYRLNTEDKPPGDPVDIAISDPNGTLAFTLAAGEYLLWGEVGAEGRAMVLAIRDGAGPYKTLRERIEARERELDEAAVIEREEPPPPPAPIAPSETVAPQVSGTPEVGRQLTCSSGTWSGTPPITFAYQWRHSGAAIAGATTASYVVQSGDTTLDCIVTAHNGGGEASAASNAVTVIVKPPPVAPSNTVAPALSGTPTVGQALTCSSGTWSGSTPIVYAYAWERDGVGIASGPSYTVQSADQGHTLRCTVTATNSAGSGTAVSNADAVAAAPPVAPHNTTAPALSGSGEEGTPLTASPGTWTGTAPITYTYQWRQEGVAIIGATTTSYTVLAADVGKAITCAVTAHNSGGEASAISNAITATAPTAGLPAGVVWTLDGRLGGASNDPWLEAVAVTAAGSNFAAGKVHPLINIRSSVTIAGVGTVTPPFGHAYLYDFVLGAYSGASTQVYGDRTEVTMQATGNAPYNGNECNAPGEARWWEAGAHFFLAWAYCVPQVNVETGSPLDPQGNIPMFQLHEPLGGTAHFGCKIRGTISGRTPHSTAEWEGADLWQESPGLITGPAAWYRMLFDVTMGTGTSGQIAVWSSRPGESVLTKRGERTGNTMGNASKLYVCMGGPRNESKNVGSAQEQRWMTAGWTQARTREAATLAAFGASL